MKFIFTTILLCSTGVFASTTDSHSLPILGTESVDSFTLMTTQTKTLYRQETKESICYRTIIVGTRMECNGFIENKAQSLPLNGGNHGPDGDHNGNHGGEHGGDRGGDHRGPGPMPSPYPYPYPQPPICREVPVYETVPYTCYETVTVPYEVFDHNTKTNITAKISSVENNNFVDCAIDFVATGDLLKANTNCSDYIALSSSTHTSEQGEANTLVQNFDFNIKLMNAKAALAPLAGGLNNLHLDGQNIIVTTGDLNASKNYTIKLTVQRKRFLQGEETYLDRVLTPSEFTYTAKSATSGETKFDLEKLVGGLTTNRKYIVKVQLDVNIKGGEILNTIIPKTHQESQIVFWKN